MTPLFTVPDIWSGTSYELALEYLGGSDDAVRRALSALWASPSLDGCYPKNDTEPNGQSKTVIASIN